MARLTQRERRRKAMCKSVVAILCFMIVVNTTLMLYMLIMGLMRVSLIRVNPNVYQNQVDALNRLVRGDDKNCHDQLRVNRHTFMRLCHLLEESGLQNSRDVTLVEKVAIFLWVLEHHNKNRPTKFQFVRSGKTVSRHFNAVLLAVLRLYNQLWYPQPVPANESDRRWKWFENCLGALDGAFVPVLPPAEDKARYRSKKGDYATNVLGVCSRNLRFIYALSGWEESVTDPRVLRNALVRRPHGLRIPQGQHSESYWVVFVGHRLRIYNNWEEAEIQVNGYPRSFKKRYNTLDDAEIALLNFHAESFRVKDMQLAQRKHKSSDWASTSTRDEKMSFIVIFSLGFVACILLAIIFHSE